MTISRKVIEDLLPLYAANECSVDSRALIDEYLQLHPQEAAELRQTMKSGDFGTATPVRPVEMEALRKTRRWLRIQSSLLAAAIFFSLLPFSFIHAEGRTYWMLMNSPIMGCAFGILGVVSWLVFFFVRHRLQIL